MSEYPEAIQRSIEELRRLQELPISFLTDNFQNLFQFFRYINLLEVLDHLSITNGATILERLPPVSEEEATLPCVKEFLHEFFNHITVDMERSWTGYQDIAVYSCVERMIRHGFIPETHFRYNQVPDEERLMSQMLQQYRAGTSPEPNSNWEIGMV